MSTLSKREAQQLVADLRTANVSAHAIAARIGGGAHVVVAAQLGAIESVLCHFLLMQGCKGAADALRAAMCDTPSDAEIAAHNAAVARLMTRAAA